MTPRVVRVAGARTGRIGVLVAPDGERSFVADRGAADQLGAGRPPGVAGSRGPTPLHLPVYSLLGEPLGLAGRRGRRARARGRARRVSVDLASIGPLLADGRRAARALIARRRARTCCSRPRPRPRRSSAAYAVEGLLEFARDRRRQARRRRAPRSWHAERRSTPPVRGRDDARRRDRHDRRRRRVRRRVPRRLVRGACGGPVPAGVAPARGAGRASRGGAPAVDAAAGAAARLTGDRGRGPAVRLRASPGRRRSRPRPGSARRHRPPRSGCGSSGRPTRRARPTPPPGAVDVGRRARSW